MYRGLIGFIGVFSLNLPYLEYQFGVTNHMRSQFRSPDSFEKFSVLFTCLFLLSSAMASISSITDITTQAASSKDSVIQGHALHISISPTMRYSGERGDLSRSFGTAFPLVVHRDLERRVLIVIEEPAFPIRLDHTLYYTLSQISGLGQLVRLWPSSAISAISASSHFMMNELKGRLGPFLNILQRFVRYLSSFLFKVNLY